MFDVHYPMVATPSTYCLLGFASLYPTYITERRGLYLFNFTGLRDFLQELGLDEPKHVAHGLDLLLERAKGEESANF
jgi:hypothetical protein